MVSAILREREYHSHQIPLNPEGGLARQNDDIWTLHEGKEAGEVGSRLRRGVPGNGVGLRVGRNRLIASLSAYI
jgi:hypothetical protein